MPRIFDSLRSTYEVGDMIWVYGHKQCKLFGRVVEVVEKERHGYPYNHYICEMDGIIDSYLDFFTPMQMNKVEGA